MNDRPTRPVHADGSTTSPTRLEGRLALGRVVPTLLISLLERRYLAPFQPSLWQVDTPPDDGARPLLHEITGMGSGGARDGAQQAMSHLLTATHSQGQAVVMALHGNGVRHRIFFGARRLAGRARGSTEDYLEGQASLLRAHAPGLRLGPLARLDGPGCMELLEFLQSAPSLATLTGVPSLRSAGSSDLQGIDRLVRAVGTQRYALMVLAEPLDAPVLDQTIDRCRQLTSEVHSLVRRTVQQSRSDTTTVSEPGGLSAPSDEEAGLPLYLQGLALFCQTAGLLSGSGALGALVQPLAEGIKLAQMTARPSDGPQQSSSYTAGSASTSELLDASAEACEEVLQRQIRRLETARSSGWWQTSVFVAAESDCALESVMSGLRGICSGDASTLDPVRVVRPASHLIRSALTRGQPIMLRSTDDMVEHPLGPAFDVMATCVSSEELSVLISLPARDIPGLPVRDAADFAVWTPPAAADSIRLGELQDPTGSDLGPVTIGEDAVARHVLVTGMPGYGKTTTAQSILLQANATWDVPFLVIQPTRSEYRALRDHRMLGGRLQVFAMDEGADARPLRLDPFRPVAGFPLLRHVELLKAVFTAAYSSCARMAHVLDMAVSETYRHAGVDLTAADVDSASGAGVGTHTQARIPSMTDLHTTIGHMLARGHNSSDRAAALRARIGDLTVGSKGRALGTDRSAPDDSLYTEPCVIELHGLADSEDKAFLIALVLCKLYEHAESRQISSLRSGLQHLTVIEEAHRLLGAPASRSSDPSGAQGRAVSVFTDLLAEMRALGESFLIVDRSPATLDPEVLKVTNVKVVHRLVGSDDRALVAGCMNLTKRQRRQLASLRPGLAIAHDDRMTSAVLVHTARATDL